MVYIKLQPNLYKILKTYIPLNKLVICGEEYYIPYPQFRRISLENNLKAHQYIKMSDIINYNQMNLVIERGKQTPQQIRFIKELKRQRTIHFFDNYTLHEQKNYSFFHYGQRSNQKLDIKSFSVSITSAILYLMTGILGYLLSRNYFDQSYSQSLLIASLFIVLTIIVHIQFAKLKDLFNIIKTYFYQDKNKLNNPIFRPVKIVKIDDKNKLNVKLNYMPIKASSACKLCKLGYLFLLYYYSLLTDNLSTKYYYYYLQKQTVHILPSNTKVFPNHHLSYLQNLAY